MKMIVSHSLIWNPASIKYMPLGLYFRLSLDDLRQRFTYIQWFRGYGRDAVCVKEVVYKYHSGEKIVLNEPVILEAFKILFDYRIKNQF